MFLVTWSLKIYQFWYTRNYTGFFSGGEKIFIAFLDVSRHAERFNAMLFLGEKKIQGAVRGVAQFLDFTYDGSSSYFDFPLASKRQMSRMKPQSQKYSSVI